MKTAVLMTVLAIVAFLTLAFAVVPNNMMMPDRDHTADDIGLAYRLFALAPMVTLVLALTFVVLAVIVWRRPRRPGVFGLLLRAALIALLIPPVIVGLMLARKPFAERIFERLDETEWATAADATTAEDEMVMGITLDGDTRAYPVKIVGYHHIIHDTVADEPVVVTY